MELIAALWQSDSAFPSGSFGFSNGIEALAATGRLKGARDLTPTLILLLRHRWATAERVALARAHRAAGDIATVLAADHAFEASSPCAPLRTGSSRNGLAYLTTHLRLETPGAAAYHSLVVAGRAPGHLPVVQGMLWAALEIPLETAIAMSLYTTAAGLSQAAVRLAAIGAIEAQRALRDALAATVDLARPPDDDAEFSSFAPFIEIAAMRHVRADVRFFGN